MNKKIPQSQIINEFLIACAESEGITDPKEIAEYVKQRKESIKKTVKRCDK